MSAFVVSKKHIASIMKFYLDDKNQDNFNYNDALDMCSELLKTNIESVNYRYCNNTEEFDEKFDFSDLDNAKKLTPVQALKAIQCLKYQSCELPNWKKTTAYQFLKKVEYLGISKLPGYDKAEWSIN